MSFQTTTTYLFDVFRVGEVTPIALIKKHAKGFMWQAYDKADLGGNGRLIRHRSAVYETEIDTLASCIAWYSKRGVDMSEQQIKVMAHMDEFGTDKSRVRDVEPAMLSAASRLLKGLIAPSDTVLNKRPAKTTPQPRSNTNIVAKSYAHLPRAVSR